MSLYGCMTRSLRCQEELNDSVAFHIIWPVLQVIALEQTCDILQQEGQCLTGFAQR